MLRSIKMSRSKIFYGTLSLIIVFSIFYYLVIYPNNKHTELLNCIQNAKIDYTNEWASNCQANKEKYSNCIYEGTDRSFCKSEFGNSSSNCSLPTALADSISKDQSNEENVCFRIYQ